jgi:glutamyl-tRNA synthetase
MSVVTRFAPSPTGYLHIGGARTALFNWLFARQQGGQFLLRIEDTDRARSTQAAIEAILDGMDWLGLHADADPVFQFSRAAQHRAAAEELIAKGGAFRCYVTPQELEARTQERERLVAVAADESRSDPERAAARAQASAAFRSPYRDGAPPPAKDAPFVIRLRAPDHGEVLIDDQVQGPVRTAAHAIDDLVLLRSDGTPTYMLAVVVDDHDMGVTHVIRGDDHLTNAARQAPIIDAMGWARPIYAHIPLIHGQDGAKLSKRHGAPEVQAYREMGYLPEAMASYLMRLGWSPGHDDILTKEEAVAQFGLSQIGRAPSRLDLDKLTHINAHFMRQADPDRLASFHWALAGDAPSTAVAARVRRAMPALQARAKTVRDIANLAAFLSKERPIALDDKAKDLIKGEAGERLMALAQRLANTAGWTETALADEIKAFAAEAGIGLGKIGPGLRAVLTGSGAALDLAQIMVGLGKDETLARLKDYLG